MFKITIAAVVVATLDSLLSQSDAEVQTVFGC